MDLFKIQVVTLPVKPVKRKSTLQQLASKKNWLPAEIPEIKSIKDRDERTQRIGMKNASSILGEKRIYSANSACQINKGNICGDRSISATDKTR